MSYARSIASVILIIFVCATYGFPQEQAVGSNTKPEDQVTQVERDWLAADAKGDVASLRRIISDDFIGSSFDGSLLNKGDIIPEGTGPGGVAGGRPGVTKVWGFCEKRVLIGVI